MTGLVPELVNAAMDPSLQTTNILRRALVIASRLHVTPLAEWLKKEMNGYSEKDDIPNYRKITGELKLNNPINGLIPFFLPSEIAENLSSINLRLSIIELIELANGEGEIFHIFPIRQQEFLMNCMEIPMQPLCLLSKHKIKTIIEHTRNLSLEWALDLESKGIIGEGMTFSEREKRIVQEQHYHFGDVIGSQIQAGSNQSQQAG